jgi:hypothetical protein
MWCRFVLSLPCLRYTKPKVLYGLFMIFSQ